MKVQITAGGVFGPPTDDNPTGEMPIGTELTLDAIPPELASRVTVLSGEGKTLTVNPAVDPLTGGAPYEARPKDGAAGWYQVYDAAGVAVGKAMREDDANTFNAMSDEEKAEFVKVED